MAETTDYFFLGRGLADGATAFSAAAGAPSVDGAFWAFLSFWAFLFFFLAKTFSSMRRSVWHAQARRPTLSVGVTGCREHVAPHFPVNALRRFSDESSGRGATVRIGPRPDVGHARVPILEDTDVD